MCNSVSELCDNVSDVSKQRPIPHKGTVSLLSVFGDLKLPFSSLLCNCRGDLQSVCLFLVVVPCTQ